MNLFNPLRYIALLILLLILNQCATTPTSEVWRPWTRTFQSKELRKTPKRLKIVIEGETTPLLGKEDLLQQELNTTLSTLLERRGILINEQSPNTLKIKYNTELVTGQNTVRTFSTSSIQGVNNELAYSLGILVANQLSYNASRTQVMQSTKTSRKYIHTISLELLNDNIGVLWKGESTWLSSNIDIRSDFLWTSQIILSGLPEVEKIIPRVPKLKKGREGNYYDIYCKEQWFSCPAVPYKITFSSFVEYGDDTEVVEIEGVDSPEALTAIVDLIRTAETALPTGTKDYSDPLNPWLWTNVKLGSQYYLGDKSEVVNILVTLRGEQSGYKIKSAEVVDDEKYEVFLNDLGKWNQALRSYYDVYE